MSVSARVEDHLYASGSLFRNLHHPPGRLYPEPPSAMLVPGPYYPKPHMPSSEASGLEVAILDTRQISFDRH